MTARLRQSILLAAAIAALAVGIVGLFSGTRLNPFLAPAEQAAERVAFATAGVYVSLRAINAAISVAQELEIGASVAAQASVQPLKVLDPVDDTVERVAGVVFAVATGATLAVVGLSPVATLGALVMGCGLIGLALSGSVPILSPIVPLFRAAARWGGALAILLPIVLSLGIGLGERLTSPSWNEANERLQSVADEARILIGEETEVIAPLQEAPSAEADPGLLERVLRPVNEARKTVGDAIESAARYQEAATKLWSEADELFRASLTLIGIFALRMVVLPAVLLWGGLAVSRRLTGPIQSRPIQS